MKCLNDSNLLIKLYLKILIIIAFSAESRLLLKKYLNKKKIDIEQKNNTKNKNIYFLNSFQSLKNLSYNNTSLFPKYRKIILRALSKYSNKKITSINNIYFDFYYKFGNMLVSLNKLIFYCEIIK